MKKRIFLFVFALLPLLMFTACEKETGDTGRLKLYLTDSPIDTDGIEKVYITVKEIQYHTNEDGWNTFSEFEEPQKYDLLDLQRGNSELLGSFELASGTYTQIRFILDAPVMAAGPKANPGCYLEFEDGSTQNLFVPSGAQTGYKAVGSFTVPANGEVEVTADFDVRKSVVKAGASGMYLLKPTIRLAVNNQAGQIAGAVTNIPEDASIIIYSYEHGSYDASEAADPDQDETRFPNAVSNDMVDEEGNYYLAFLAAGDYDLVVTSVTGDGLYGVLGVIENITVESNKTSVVDIDIEEL